MASGADWLALLPGGWVPGWQVVCLLLLAGNALFIGRNILLVTACQQRDQTLWLSPLLLISCLLVGFLGWASFSTISAWSSAPRSPELLNLLTSVFLAHLLLAIFQNARSRPASRSWRDPAAIIAAIEVPAACLLLFSGGSQEYFYHSVPRLRGAFHNPNAAGLFAVLNLLLVGYALTLLCSEPAQPVQRRSFSSREKLLFLGLFGLEFSVQLFALIASFSRGAWISLLAAIIFLGRPASRKEVARQFARLAPQGQSWLKPLAAFLIPGLVAITLLCLQLPPRTNVYTHRLASVVDGNDFSARNRTLALVAMIRAAGDAWAAGYGLADLPAILQAYYSPQPAGVALPYHLNSFGFVASGLGLPALAALFSAILIALLASPPDDASASAPRFCQAALCAICAAFIFNGGLLSLAGGCAFWIALLFAVHPESRLPSGRVFGGVLAAGGLLLVPILWLAVTSSRAETFSFSRLSFSGWNGDQMNGCVVTARSIPPRGLIVLAHGSGNRWSGDGPLLRAFAAHGYHCATFDYHAGSEAQFHDDFSRFRSALRQRAEMAGLPVIWCGDSWGAFEILFESIQSSLEQPSAVVCVSGPWTSVDFRIREALAGRSKSELRKLPPVVMVHGALDEVFPVRSCQEISQVLSNSGLTCSLGILPACGHIPGVHLDVLAASVAGQLEKLPGRVHPATGSSPVAHRLALTSYASVLWHLELLLMVLVSGSVLIFCSIGVLRSTSTRLSENISRQRRFRLALGLLGAAAVFGLCWIRFDARLAATRPQPLSPTEASARTDLNKLAHHGFLDVISGKDRAPEDFVKLTDYQSRMVAGQWFGGGDSASLASKLLADSFRAGGPLHDDASAQEIETSLRRPLWELFYPLVQYRTNPLEAARVVAASLAAYQSEVEITLLYGGAFAHRKLAPIPRSALYAASMRALGVPTRETATGEIEIFSGQGWSPAPQIDDITFKEIQPPKL